MQTPEAEENWERSAASLTLGHRHRHSTGAGRPRGTRDTGGGTGDPAQDDPRGLATKRSGAGLSGTWGRGL